MVAPTAFHTGSCRCDQAGHNAVRLSLLSDLLGMLALTYSAFSRHHLQTARLPLLSSLLLQVLEHYGVIIR